MPLRCALPHHNLMNSPDGSRRPRVSKLAKGSELQLRLNAIASTGFSPRGNTSWLLHARSVVLARLHPKTAHVRDKIRQQLQVLRDLGLIEFCRSWLLQDALTRPLGSLVLRFESCSRPLREGG